MVIKELKKILGSIFFLIASLTINAQNFTANVDKIDIDFGEMVQLTYKLSNATGTNFTPPAFIGMRVMSGPQVSNEITFNGRVTTSGISYKYILQAAKKGKITIRPAAIEVSGKMLHSNSVTINVSSGNNVASKQKGESIFMRAVPNKSKALQGEAIAISYKLYVAGNITMSSPTLTKMPTFTGFWAETGKMPQKMEQEEETYNGRTYSVFIIRKLILFPQQTGTLTVDPLEIECTGQMEVQNPVNPLDPFSIDNFFNQNVVPFHKTIVSDATKIVVLPLPEENKPASFSGMVGEAAISAYADHDTVKANEPISYRVTIGGEGNLSLQQPVKLNLPPEIEVYEPKTIDKFDRSGDNLTGTRTFEYTLMPHKQGSYTIPAIAFSYFDPVKRQYFESKTNAITLNVEKNDDAASDHSLTGTKKAKESLPGYMKWSIILSSAILLFFVVLLAIRRKSNQTLVESFNENPFQLSEYNIYLNKAASLVDNDENGEFYSVMINALFSFVEQTLQIPFSDISRESIKSGLQNKNIAEELISNYLKVIDQCEMVKFAPAGFKPNKETILNNGKEAIKAVMSHES